MNITKQICLTALVCVMVLCLKGEEKMPRKQARTTSNASQTETAVAGTGNLSKKRREELIGKINEIRAFLEQSGDTNAARLITFASELEKEVRQKKYGLVFEEHKERVDVELENNLPVLTENKSRFIDKGGELNFLIEGDNLAALKLLEKTHKGKIDLIYIDPPYNTGNKDFVYNDSYVEKEDTFRHSKWLSFMRKRLEVSKNLLSREGVIFISIDDNEQSNLRLLCDAIFDEERYVGTFFWKRTETAPALSNKIRRKLEFVLCYERTDIKGRKFAQGLVDGDDAPLLNEGNPLGVLEFPKGSVHFSIGDGVYKHKYGQKITLLDDVIVKEGLNVETFRAKGHFKWGQENLDREVAAGTYFLIKSNKFSPRYQKPEASTKLPSNLIDADVGVGTNEDAQKEVTDAGVNFSYAKPSSLIAYLVRMPFWGKNDTTTLDFFAGSGTTGHAVMKLNAEDGGKRKFILVTNNENDICEKVTYERLKRVIKKEGYKAQLKYFKIDYVPIARKVYFEYADELLKHIRELVELENAIDFSKDETIAITVTDKEFEKFVANEKKMEGKKAVYVGHDVLIGAKAKKVLQGKGIEIRIIPEYYYAEQEG